MPRGAEGTVGSDPGVALGAARSGQPVAGPETGSAFGAGVLEVGAGEVVAEAGVPSVGRAVSAGDLATLGVQGVGLADAGDGTPGSGAPVWRVVEGAGPGDARLVRVNTTVGISSRPSAEGSLVPEEALVAAGSSGVAAAGVPDGAFAPGAGVAVTVAAGADVTGAVDEDVGGATRVGAVGCA